MKLAHTLKTLYLTRAEPVGLIHFLTNRCNARCSFCFIDFDNKQTQSKQNEMTTKQIIEMTKTMGKSLQHVNLTGGEPFLRSDLFEIVKGYFDNANVGSILINSNGTYTKRVREFVKKLNEQFPEKRVIIQFSIDSFPEDHNKIRKVPGLFDKTMESYNIVNNEGNNVIASIALTVTHANYFQILKIYDFLINNWNISRISPIVVRDEGVNVTPIELKTEIIAAYKSLVDNINNDRENGKLRNYYDKSTIKGRVLNEKDKIQYENNFMSYTDPHFISYCPSGKIFGVISTDGSVHPCEIIDKPLGNLNDFNFDFLKLWNSEQAKGVAKWVKETKCHCTYECAMTYNVMSNYKYQPRLIKKALGF